MENDFSGFSGKVSLFDAPIAPFKDEWGNFTKATLNPVRSVDLTELHAAITGSEVLRMANELVLQESDYRMAKSRYLSYVTPFGEFSQRNAGGLVRLSGYFPIDIDKLRSRTEAEEVRDRLMEDPFLNVALAFLSPSQKGVKLFVSYAHSLLYILGSIGHEREKANALQNSQSIYLRDVYFADRPEVVDTTGKDMARACFLSYDPAARLDPARLVRDSSSFDDSRESC